jgi:hypothetical protein
MSRLAPKLDREMLTRAHVLLCDLEKELRESGRGPESDLLGYIDLIVLMVRHSVESRRPVDA